MKRFCKESLSKSNVLKTLNILPRNLYVGKQTWLAHFHVLGIHRIDGCLQLPIGPIFWEGLSS